jgi:catechol 2,3-dioxygenase
MGASTRDIFGGAGRAEPAVAGSYGQPPRGFRLPDSARLGRVRLQVSELTRSLAFYQNVLGLRLIERHSSDALLAAEGDDTPLVELRERRGARPMPRRGALGLYHFAILLPDRPALGRFLRHLGEIGAQAGASDHLVSESLYLQDPDNLGIEVYADRPRNSWNRVDRELMMATDPLDAAGLLQAAGNVKWQSMPEGTTIGHLHLHVGDLDQAAAFYSETVGFDRTVWHYPGALFMAAGGYHHHLGTNTWAGPDAVPSPEQDARLIEWTIELPDWASLSALAEGLAGSGHSVQWQENSANRGELVTQDPWGTQLRIQMMDTAAMRA